MGVTSFFSDFWKSSSRAVKNINRLLKGEMIETYTLNSPEKIDVEKCRAIYNNTANEYKLAAGMIKPIINADVSFIGEPVFISENPGIQDILRELNKSKVGFFQAVHKVALRERDGYVWVQWDDIDRMVKWHCLPNDKLKDIVRDPVTNEIVQYVFEWHVSYRDRLLANRRMTISILIDADVIVYKYSGDVPPGYVNETVRNVLREIPVVQVSNEKEDFEMHGHSEITALEPYLKAYHDVMMMALQAQKNNSAPKMKFKVGNVQNFVDNNWGAGAYEAYQRGDTPEGFSVENLDLVFMQDGDDADYMTVQSTTGSAQPLLQLLFTLIVETSETIEVVFGANLGTSLASVNAQLPVYIKKIERKQRQFQMAWEKVVTLSLKFLGFANVDVFDTDDVKVIWPTVDFETAKDKAEILSKNLQSFGIALKSNILNFEEVHKSLKEIVPDQEDDFQTHLNGVKDTAMLVQRFLEDSESQMIENEGEREIDVD